MSNYPTYASRTHTDRSGRSGLIKVTGYKVQSGRRPSYRGGGVVWAYHLTCSGCGTRWRFSGGGYEGARRAAAEHLAWACTLFPHPDRVDQAASST